MNECLLYEYVIDLMLIEVFLSGRCSPCDGSS